MAILLRLYVLPQAWLTLDDFVLLRLYVLPQAWVTLDDFVLFRLYVLPQAWVTLDDFGYSASTLCPPSSMVDLGRLCSV